MKCKKGFKQKKGKCVKSNFKRKNKKSSKKLLYIMLSIVTIVVIFSIIFLSSNTYKQIDEGDLISLQIKGQSIQAIATDVKLFSLVFYSTSLDFRCDSEAVFSEEYYLLDPYYSEYPTNDIEKCRVGYWNVNKLEYEGSISTEQ